MTRRAENAPYFTTTSTTLSALRNPWRAVAARLVAATLWVILAVLSAGPATAAAASLVGQAPKQTAASV
jgi:hypothetical protein